MKIVTSLLAAVVSFSAFAGAHNFEVECLNAKSTETGSFYYHITVARGAAWVDTIEPRADGFNNAFEWHSFPSISKTDTEGTVEYKGTDEEHPFLLTIQKGTILPEIIDESEFSKLHFGKLTATKIVASYSEELNLDLVCSIKQ